MLRPMSTKSGGTECNGDDIQSRWQTKPNHSVNQHGLSTRFWFHVNFQTRVYDLLYSASTSTEMVAFNAWCYMDRPARMTPMKTWGLLWVEANFNKQKKADTFLFFAF